MPKQHTCAICSRQFQRKAELDRHAKRQTPCQPPTYKCDRCEKGMNSYQTLWRNKRDCKKVKDTLVEPLQETGNLRAEKAEARVVELEAQLKVANSRAEKAEARLQEIEEEQEEEEEEKEDEDDEDEWY